MDVVNKSTLPSQREAFQRCLSARELARLGVSVVQGDVDDEQSLKSAFEGMWPEECHAIGPHRLI